MVGLASLLRAHRSRRMARTTTAAPHSLLERSGQLEALERLLGEPRGRLALVGGEAGIGKSALVREFCAGRDALWGACDALYTPRPLGPLVDIAGQAGGELSALIEEDAPPAALVAALAGALASRRSALVVLEDLHWADEATLDVLRLLVRRLSALPALVVATYRDDELDRAHPLRIVLGELPAGVAERIALPPLTPAAVAELAGGQRVDHDELHRRTGGNPFYVTEVLAAGGGAIPDTVRDAVLARVARLDAPARALLDAVAIVPQRVELWLLEALAGPDLAGLDACLASGVLRAGRDAVGFRHEIARRAVEEAVAPHRRRELHRRALGALADGRRDLARLAHHAEAAGDGAAVLEHAPAAAERAARLGSHREAAAQLARALRWADGLPAAQRAELLDRRSYECYLTNHIDDAIEARREALEQHRAAGDPLREGDTHRWLSRLSWFHGDGETAGREARRAVELLERLEPGPELAMAYSNMAQLRMLAGDEPATTAWGGLAIELAERLGETAVLAHALNNVGAVLTLRDWHAGAETMRRSLELALAADLEEHVARAYTNLATSAVDMREYDEADRYLSEGLEYCAGRDLDSWTLYMLGYKARAELERGDWDTAAISAHGVVDHPGVIRITSRITPLAVIGRLRARRGDPGPWEPLDEALALARSSGEVQRLAPVAVARAEARWLAGDDEAAVREIDAPLALARETGDGRWTAELHAWRRRAGAVEVVPEDLTGPYALELAGSAAAAAEAWRALGCPYEAALALAYDGPDGARAAIAELNRLGARASAACVARRLGVRGPRAATRANPGGLTAREIEVVELLAAGLRNADIADRLVVSPRTVEHHVASILRKLDVKTRGQAGAAAARLGIVER
jgi:DNA-binding CsgD family transcriptional regulator/tetratricopeptide (TPR) repeat protein